MSERLLHLPRLTGSRGLFSFGPRLRWTGALLASILILTGFTAAALRVLPRVNGSVPALYYQEPSGQMFSPGEAPVFVMRPDHSVVRHGTAVIQPNGRVKIDLFPSTAEQYADASEAILADPTFGILWAAASESSQAELRRRLTRLQDNAAQAVERIITSDVFTREYRPALRAMMTDALSSAWRDPRTQQAVEKLMAGAEPALRRTLQGEVKAVLINRMSSAVWQMIRANWANALGTPFGYELDYQPMIRALTETLADPRLHEVLVNFGRAQLDTPEAQQLTERIVIGAFDALLRDRRVPGVVTDMFWDVRLRAMLQPFTDSVMALAGALPQHLGGLGSESSLNPLAAHVFKAFAVSSRTPLILLVTPTDLKRIQRMENGTAVQLRRIGAGS